MYYAPRLDANYFFHGGLYWVYVDDGWYSSSVPTPAPVPVWQRGSPQDRGNRQDRGERRGAGQDQ